MKRLATLTLHAGYGRHLLPDKQAGHAPFRLRVLTALRGSGAYRFRRLHPLNLSTLFWKTTYILRQTVLRVVLLQYSMY